MAVKQKNVVGPVVPAPEVHLQMILRFLENIQPHYEPQKIYSKLVMILGTVTVPSDTTAYMEFIEDIKRVQAILMKENEKENVVYVTLKALYDEISNPGKIPSPVMSIVLQLISPEFLPHAVKFILKSNYPETNLECALHTLCTWLTKWTCTDNLGPLVLTFMQGLELDGYHNILVKVTMATIEPLFKLLILPSRRQTIWPVVQHMLSRMQNSPKAFHRIIPNALSVIEILTRDNQFDLLELGKLLIVLMEHFPGYDELYQPLKEALAAASVAPTYQTLNCQGWTLVRSKCGLYNLGNTCYMNSVLQALFMTKSFRKNCITKPQVSQLFHKLQSLFVLLQHSVRPVLNPKDILMLLKPPGFHLGQQHDSSEFLGYLLDSLHEQEQADDDSVVQRHFGGKTMTVSHCGQCGTKYEKLDTFRELQLSFPPKDDEQPQSVQTLLEYFLQPEKLCGDNQYRCDVCNQLTDGERVMKIVESPTHLIFTLKHFRFDPKSQTRTKLLQNIHLNQKLLLDGACFELYGAVVHYGQSVDSGHYYTFAKDNLDWYKFNDSNVMKTTEDSLHCLNPPETPYILFYVREDVVEPEELVFDSLSDGLKELVRNDQQEVMVNNIKVPAIRNVHKDDDPPPPGCGGGGDFTSISGNMFVC